MRRHIRTAHPAIYSMPQTLTGMANGTWNSRLYQTTTPSWARISGRKSNNASADAKLILETAAKYGVPVDMRWKPTGSAVSHQTGFA